MDKIAVLIPALIYKDNELEDARHKIRLSWLSVKDAEIPVYFLAMGDKTNKIKKSLECLKQAKIIEVDRYLHPTASKDLLCRLAKKDGYKRVLLGDDDFEIKEGFSEEYKDLCNISGNLLLCSNKRLWFTALKNKSIIYGIFKRSGQYLSVTKGTRVWEQLDNFDTLVYALWTREGIVTDVDSYQKSREWIDNFSEIPSWLSENIKVAGFDDLGINAYNAYNDGITVAKVRYLYHKQGKNHKETLERSKARTKHGTPYSESITKKDPSIATKDLEFSKEFSERYI